jgi:hypothetical protein
MEVSYPPWPVSIDYLEVNDYVLNSVSWELPLNLPLWKVDFETGRKCLQLASTYAY